MLPAQFALYAIMPSAEPGAEIGTGKQTGIMGKQIIICEKETIHHPTARPLDHRLNIAMMNQAGSWATGSAFRQPIKGS